MSSPSELRQEAHRLDGEAARREETAAHLLRTMGEALDIATKVVGAIDDAVWQGGAARAANEVIWSSQRQVQRAEEHVIETAEALRREVEELRADAARLRRQADAIEPQIRPPVRGW